MTFGEWIRKPDSALWDVFPPFILFALVVVLLVRRVRGIGWREIPVLPLLVALPMLFWVHWTMFDYGIVLSDEIAGLIPEGWSFLTYVRADPGMPSRFYRLLAWQVLPEFGLTGMHLLNTCIASLAAVLLTSSGHRLAGFWGGCAAWLVLLHVPWLFYTWQARPYALFLFGSCWALWQLVSQANQTEGLPVLDGFVLIVMLGALDNPFMAILVASCCVVTLRRYGPTAIAKRVWISIALITVGLAIPVLGAVLMHQRAGHGVQPATYQVLGIGIVLALPAVFRSDRRGWIAETAVLASIVVGFCMWKSWVPAGERVILFLLPWLLIGFLGWAASLPKLGSTVILVTLLGGLYASSQRLSEELFNRARWHHDAREVHSFLLAHEPAKVRFSPSWSREMYLSNVFDMRHIRFRNYTDHPPSIPTVFHSKQKPTCASDEVVVDWVRRQPTCDCLLVKNTKTWKVYDCAQPAVDVPLASVQGEPQPRAIRPPPKPKRKALMKKATSTPEPLAGKSKRALCGNNDLLLTKNTFEHWKNGGWRSLCCEGPEPVYTMSRCEMDWPTSGVPPCRLWEDLRNNVYALYGYPFRSEELRNEYASQKWYERREDFDESWLSEAAQANVALLKDYRSHQELACIEDE